MSIAIQLDVRDALSRINGIERGLDAPRLQPIVGRSAVNVYRAHLFALNQERPNRLGGPRTNFYAQAARGTSWRQLGDAVVVSIASVGIRQRYYGGTIKPKVRRYLTIPAVAEAYGKRASEFPELKFALVPDPRSGRLRPALVRKDASEVTLIDTRTVRGRTKVFKREGQGRVLFWLVRQVQQQPDPSVLPSQEAVQGQVSRDLNDYVTRLIERAGGTPQN